MECLFTSLFTNMNVYLQHQLDGVHTNGLHTPMATEWMMGDFYSTIVDCRWQFAALFFKLPIKNILDVRFY